MRMWNRPLHAPASPSPSPPATKPTWSADDAPESGRSPDLPHDGLRREVELLRDEVAKLKKEVEDLWANFK